MAGKTAAKPNKELPSDRKSFWQRFGGTLIALAVLLTAGALLAFAVLIGKESRSAPPTEPPPVNVHTETVEPIATVADSFELPGMVEPNRVVKAPAEVAGRIERIEGEEGDRVEAGRELVFLNTELLEAEHQRAKADAEYAERELERVRELRRRGVATENELDVAVSNAVKAAAALKTAATRLERAVIKARISGVLNRLPVEVGEYVQPGSTVAEIVDLDKVKVAVDVPERDVHYFRKGQTAKVIFPSVAVERAGEITWIDELADPQTRTVRFELTVDNAHRELRTGQIVTAVLIRRVLHGVIFVPLGAVIPTEEGHVVYVAADGVAERRKVRLGMLRGTTVRVLDGLSAGDRLIVQGHRYVGPGQEVSESPADYAATPTMPATAPASAPAATTGRASPDRDSAIRPDATTAPAAETRPDAPAATR